MRRLLRSRTDYRPTLERNLLTSLILHEVIITTKTKAVMADRAAVSFWRRVKKADFTAKRFAHQFLLDKNAVAKLFDEVLPRYQDGEQMLTALPYQHRAGDNAAQYLVKLTHAFAVKPKVETESKPEAKPKAEPKAKKAAPAKASKVPSQKVPKK